MTLSTAFLIVCVAAIAYLIGFYHGGKFVLKTMREHLDTGASPTPDQGEQPGTALTEKGDQGAEPGTGSKEKN